MPQAKISLSLDLDLFREITMDANAKGTTPSIVTEALYRAYLDGKIKGLEFPKAEPVVRSAGRIAGRVSEHSKTRASRTALDEAAERRKK